MLLRPTLRGFGDIGAQLLRKRAVVLRPLSELFAIRNDFALDPRCAHAAVWSVSRKGRAARVAVTKGNGKAAARRNFSEASPFVCRRVSIRTRRVQHQHEPERHTGA